MEVTLWHEFRAPTHLGCDPEAIYREAVEQCAWADVRAPFTAVSFSEHHASDDGYNPSPIVSAAAVASRTRRLKLRFSAIILPLHDPLRLAEDVAVLDVLSGGRTALVLGAGYRPTEFEMFGRDMSERGHAMEEGIAALRSAWRGEPFTYRGRPALVLPRPVQRPHPPILMGASSVAAARRAARIADGFVPVPGMPEVVEAYGEERQRLGLPPMPQAGPILQLAHLCEDTDEAWRTIGPYLLHHANSYRGWSNEAAGRPFSGNQFETVEALRASGIYNVLTPEECIDAVRSRGVDTTLVVNPMIGGLPPDRAWASLELLADRVLSAFDPTSVSTRSSSASAPVGHDRLVQLEEIEAIKKLKARYFRLLDQKRWDEWTLLFTEDVALTLSSTRPPERRTREAFVDYVKSSLEGATSVHHGHTPEITILGPDLAAATWPMNDSVRWDDRSLAGAGYYFEEYQKGPDGRWRIASLRLDRLRVNRTGPFADSDTSAHTTENLHATVDRKEQSPL